MKSILDRNFIYVPSKDQTVDRLKERFQQIRDEIEANKKEATEKVSAIKPRVKARTA